MIKKGMLSFNSLVFCWLLIFIASFFYYPKWKKVNAEASISWDVSGYYLYLPALFIYKDIRHVKFLDGIIEKYHPTYDPQQVFRHENGNYVMKYSIGQALQYLPFFAIAHLYASFSDHEADGFSAPYQFMIALDGLIYAIIGLIFLRLILLKIFSDKVTALAILFIAVGTNYFDYSAINGPMAHCHLFAIYSILIWVTISFYRNPSLLKASAIGFLVGLAAITRPTEIISFIIPVLWGIKIPLHEALKNRLEFFRKNFSKVAIAMFICAAIGSIQLIYWKYVSGDWIVYSYRDQGFSWLHPHLIDGIFSYKTGWIVYSPMMIFALLGFVPLYRKKNGLFWSSAIFSCLFIYIAFAWDEWWYGGSLGQRTMVQSYAILAIPLGFFITTIYERKILKWIFFGVCAIFIYYNLWLTHQAHRGGLLHVGQMNKAYFWKVLGKYDKNENDLKLLDTNESFNGTRKNVQQIYFNNFENDTSATTCVIPAIEGNKSICLTKESQYSPIYFIDAKNEDEEWVRVSAIFRCVNKEWDTWKMTQFVIRFYHDDEIIKYGGLRVYRILGDNETKDLFFDVRQPHKQFNRIGILFDNGGSDKAIAIDSLRIERSN